MTEQGTVDIEALARETSVSVDVLRCFAAISGPANAHLFTAEAAHRAFGVEPDQDIRI